MQIFYGVTVLYLWSDDTKSGARDGAAGVRAASTGSFAGGGQARASQTAAYETLRPALL